MKKLLVTGISGFLGWHMAMHEQYEWQLTGIYNSQFVELPNVEIAHCDLTDKRALRNFINQLKPDAIVHLAANSNANFCEHNSTDSRAINVSASAQLAELAKEVKVPFLFTSTDLVFDGTKAPYKEDDPTTPVSVYGAHKELAEQKIRDNYPSSIIARMPLMYGLADTADSFASHWIRKLKNGEVVHAFTDEYRTALSGHDAAAALFLLLEKNASGTWHLGGGERLSRYDFATEMAKQFDLPTHLIKASVQADVNMAAKRPPDVSLNSEKAKAIGFNPHSTIEALQKMKK